MKPAKRSIQLLALFMGLSLSTFAIYPAANELKIPAELDSIFPVITRGALYIAERVNLNIVDCLTLSDSCDTPENSPRDAFIQTALNALYTNSTEKIYPNVQALLVEIGHIPATTELDADIEDQLKKLITYVDYMHNLIQILPTIYAKNTGRSYTALNIVTEARDKKRFIIDYNSINTYTFAQQLRFSCKAFFSKSHALKELDVARNDIKAYLINPEEFIKNKQLKKEKEEAERLALAKLDFF